MERDFPRFSKIYEGYWHGISDGFPEDMHKELEKRKSEWFEGLLGNWQVLYSQCANDMKGTDCINHLDINRCYEVGSKEDIGEHSSIDGEFEKSTCFALAAFLKRNRTICENQFYLGTEVNCNIWLKDLLADCPTCGKESLVIENATGYFNWLDGAKVSMRDISFCEGMVDQKEKDHCFTSAAMDLDVKYCLRVSEEPQFPEISSSEDTRRDFCYSMCALKSGEEEICDKINDSQSRQVCHQFQQSQKQKKFE